ncbi:MAG: hypothetical protein ACLUI3_02510 [Christensenellales bacterium]
MVNEALMAAKTLAERESTPASSTSAPSPLDEEIVIEAAKAYGKVITCEGTASSAVWARPSRRCWRRSARRRCAASA